MYVGDLAFCVVHMHNIETCLDDRLLSGIGERFVLVYIHVQCLGCQSKDKNCVILVLATANSK